jgi:hypothetical protein
VREDPERQGLLYLGTEFGFYVSANDGASWLQMQRNLPVVPITDIKVQRRDLVLSTMGRSFWILDDVTPLLQYAEANTSRKALLYAPRPAMRWRHQGTPAGPGVPEYPAAGASIDYWLGSTPSSAPVIEIRNALGAVVRTFTTAAAAQGAPSAQGMRAPRRGSTAATAITDAVGANRFTWNLMHATTPGGAGPMVAPGRYTVRLIVDGDTMSQPLLVQADPRVRTDGITDAMLVAQEAHQLAVRNGIEQARAMVARARDIRTQMQTRGAPMVREADDIVRALETADGRYQAPKLLAQFEYLYGMTLGADQRVPRDASARLVTLNAELAAIRKRLDALGRMTTAALIP